MKLWGSTPTGILQLECRIWGTWGTYTKFGAIHTYLLIQISPSIVGPMAVLILFVTFGVEFVPPCTQ